ncbi:MAG: 4-alpha-glucanotransferase [Bacteroidales bacterium]|nr:4-alpha-glucanotransferase [Bacteroidales bacterium]
MSSIHFNSVRRAGILLHITSLPGKYGIGDLGPSAYRFIDFLERTGQRYWQCLPVGQPDKENGYSPYSTLSAFAGNTMLISPDILHVDGLLSQHEISAKTIKPQNKVDFDKATEIKTLLFETAYDRFKKYDNKELTDAYAKFCKENSYWLNDYVLFKFLKEKYSPKKWNQWPKVYRDKQPDALQKLQDDHKSELEKEKFIQFCFFRQWNSYREFCRKKKISIIGDISIYVSYNSADVWNNPQYFGLKDDKSLKWSAGVPPDYYSVEGQFWNMPVYNWSNLKIDGYNWWKERIAHNLKLFDIVRLDHFRAFYNYWEIPAEEPNAVNGVWKLGPGKDFFRILKKQFPDMPFIAEDLGDVVPGVYKLRDSFGMPGMHILQFAFGSDIASNVHIPHNHRQNGIVYTGTHDNNTIKGWFRSELDKQCKIRYKKYLGRRLTKRNCCKSMIGLCYASVANTAIVPMQDILGLNEKNRLNKPSTSKNNWTWKLKDLNFSKKTERFILNLMKLYGRYPVD